MAVGPGKYDDVCTQARASADAQGTVLIVINGRLGHGFSVQADYTTILRLPDLLEELARQLRADHASLMPPNPLGH